MREFTNEFIYHIIIINVPRIITVLSYRTIGASATAFYGRLILSVKVTSTNNIQFMFITNRRRYLLLIGNDIWLMAVIVCYS